MLVAHVLTLCTTRGAHKGQQRFLGSPTGAGGGAGVASQAAAGTQVWMGLAGASLPTKPTEPAASRASLKSA